MVRWFGHFQFAALFVSHRELGTITIPIHQWVNHHTNKTPPTLRLPTVLPVVGSCLAASLLE